MDVRTIILYNPRYKKSLQTLELLHREKISRTIRLYLEYPPPKNDIKEILSLSGATAINLI
jgi:arsenate reductase-like glutaredoxin family protein